MEGYVWLGFCYFLRGKTVWVIAISGRGRVASVGSRCLGCLARRFGDLDQARTPKSVVGISKYGTLSSQTMPRRPGSFIIYISLRYLKCPNLWQNHDIEGGIVSITFPKFKSK
jgi:hypothetical protein